MNHKFIISAIALFIAATCTTSCSSGNDALDIIAETNNGIEWGEDISSEEASSSEDPDNTYTLISYTEDGGTIIEMPINILSHSEFEETLKTKVFKDTNTPMLMDSEPCAKVSPRGNSYDVTPVLY